jgi:structural maintenance of chromosome 1
MDYIHRQSQKEKNVNKALAEMKKLNPGKVHGRLHELCKIKQSKYQKAVEIVCGKQTNAVVVDDDKTAKDCIHFLNEQRLPKMDFLPLETLTVERNNTNVKGRYKGVLLAIDALDYDNKYGRAIEYVCGNSIICDTRAIAQDMKYKHKIPGKAVDLEGTVYRENTMEGGRVEEDKSSKKWGEDASANINANLEKLSSSLHELHAQLSADKAKEQEANHLVTQLTNQLTDLGQDLKGLERNIDDKKNSHAFFTKQLQECKPKYDQEAKALEEIRSNLKTYQDAIFAVEDEVFAAWCQRLGYEDIRDYESRQGSLNREANEERSAFEKTRRQLEGELDTCAKSMKHYEERIQALEDQIKVFQDQIASLKDEKEAMQERLDEMNAELEELNESLATQTEKARKRAAAVAEQRTQSNERNKAVGDIKTEVQSLEATVKRSSANRYGLLRQCRIDELNLPLVEGSKELKSLPLDDLLREDPDAMEVDDEEDDEDRYLTTKVAEVPDYGIEVDFSDLDDELKEVCKCYPSLTHQTLTIPTGCIKRMRRNPRRSHQHPQSRARDHEPQHARQRAPRRRHHPLQSHRQRLRDRTPRRQTRQRRVRGRPRKAP